MVVASPEPPPWLDVEAQEAAGPTAAAAAGAAPRSSAPLRVADAAVLNVPAPPAPAPTLQPTALGQRWATVVAGLAEKNLVAALLRELAMQAELRSTEGPPDAPQWQLVVERESLRTDALRDKLAAVLAQSLGHPITLELVAGVPQDSPARRDAALRAQRQAQAEDSVRTDPLVVEMLAQFKGARIVPGSIKPL
jgi:DNA polymerase III subunit gamma/tau